MVKRYAADTANSTSPSPDESVQFQDLEHYVDAYESELASCGLVADVATFVPNHDHPDLHDIVTELLRVDLEHRYRNGEPTSLDEYIGRFPATLSLKSNLRELAFEDYRIRHVAGDSPDAVEYTKRFGIDTAGWSEMLGDATAETSGQPANHLDEDSPGSGDSDDLLKVGQTVFDFKILCEFGRGSFSKVYLAQQGDLANRFVVLKASRQHWDESDILARLQHTNIMPIHSVHRLDDLQIVCMPFWGTCTLSDVLGDLGEQRSHRSGQALLSTIANHQHRTVVSHLKESRTPPTIKRVDDEADDSAPRIDSLDSEPTQSDRSTRSYVNACLLMVADIADALSHAHQRGIVHSDLKPANILLADDGRPLVLDFNLATREGAIEKGVGGTLPYMAPEHLERMKKPQEREPQFASDIFSVGVMLFELLTGRKPFPQRDGEFEDVIDQLIVDRQQVSLDFGSADISNSVESILRRCLSSDLQTRYASADELRDDLLAQLANKPLRHAPETIRQRITKFLKRNRKHVATSAAIGLGFVALVGLLAAFAKTRQNARLVAEAEHIAFSSDAEWMTSVLTSPIVGDRQLAHARSTADNWFTKFQDADSLPIDSSERMRLKTKLGELALAMAENQLEQAFHLSPNQERSELLHDATIWNEKAASYFNEDPIAIEMQRNQIDAASTNQPSGPASENEFAISQTMPKTALGHELLARQLARTGQLRDALDALNRANEMAPMDYSVWAQLGSTHRGLLEFSEAERCFTMCVNLRPELAFSYFQRGVVRLENNDYRMAGQDFDRYLDLRPKSANALINRALAFKGQGKYQLAIKDLDTAEQLGACEPRLFLIRSELCHALGDKLGMAKQLHLGLDCVPQDERNWLSRGMAFLRKGDTKRALSDFEAAARANPNSINARKNIAHVMSDHLAKLDDAIEAIDDAIRIRPNDAELLASRAVLSARAGNKPSARKDATAALSIRQDVATLIRAAGVYALTKENDNDIQQAVGYVRQAMAKDPRWAKLVAGDPDLATLRNNKRFQEIIKAANTLLK